MRKTICVLSIFLFPTLLLAEGSTEARNSFQCMSTLEQFFSPYAGLPEYAGTFEHFRVKKQSVRDKSMPGGADVFVVDDKRVLGDSGVDTRFIFSTKGIFKCYYPENLKPEDLVIDGAALGAGDGANILKRNRTLMPRMGITCRKEERFPPELKEMMETYVKWSPNLYQEMLITKSMDDNFDRVAGNYSPQQMDFNLNPCKTIAYGVHREDIKQKIRRFENTWGSVLRTRTAVSPQDNNYRSNSTDGIDAD